MLSKQFKSYFQMSVIGTNIEKIQNLIYFRLSRARRVVENAFGIMASRFRVLRQPILQNYENAIQTVKANVQWMALQLKNVSSWFKNEMKTNSK